MLPEQPPFPPVDERLPVDGNQIASPGHHKFLHLLPEDRINILVPAGIGDLYWTLCKLQQRGAIFWVPDTEQRRTAGLAEMVGIEYGYLPGLTTDYLWSRPGSPKIDGPGIYEVQPNRHLEAGCPLETWYPQYPMDRPTLKPGYRILDSMEHVFVFLCSDNYMAGQLAPEIWASTLRLIEERHGQIVICGASRDVEYAKRVNALMGGTCKTLFDQPLNEVMAWILAAKLVVGVASGLLILAISHRIPTLIAYPRHLGMMPGTWEPPDARWRWCYLDSIQRCVVKGWDNDVIA